MGEPSAQTNGLGERRRRREAERARAAAAGGSRPLTRREIRARELEERARLEAIASGELRLADPGGAQPASPASPAGQSPELAPTAQSSSAVPSGASPELAPTAQSSSAVPSGASPELAPTAQSSSAVPSGGSPADAPTAPSAPVAPGAHAPHAPTTQAPSDASANSGTHVAAARSGDHVAQPGSTPMSRRAMRSRLRDEPTGPSARAGAGRRPVRAPSTSHGARAVRPIGEISDLQPVDEDEDRARLPGATVTEVRHGVGSADPAAWESALDLPPLAAEAGARAPDAAAHAAFSVDDGVRSPAAGEQHRREAAAESGEVQRPHWAAVAAVGSPSAASPGTAQESVAERSAAERARPAATQAERARPAATSAVTALRYLLLIAAGVVIGVLVAVLATNGDDNSAAVTDPRAEHVTVGLPGVTRPAPDRPTADPPEPIRTGPTRDANLTDRLMT